MQHAGLQYGQGAANSHQTPPFAHADIPQNTGGTTSSLRQFRKKDGTEKNSSTELNTSIETQIARVPPHSHFPARPNDYFRYQHQYPDYNPPFKETPAQVKYSEIAETPQHVDQMPAALHKHKEVHKDFMDMCNISQQTHMKQNYPDNMTRQQSYPPDAASVHHQYLHKEPQVHPGYKPESQYQQYPQIPKYNMPSQCRKYPPPPPENDFLAKLQRINPSMARSIMSDHHLRESQTTYPTMDQSRMYPQNQRYYPPTHLQNNPYNYQPYNYSSSCNYKHPEYPRPNQMSVGSTQYPTINPHSDRSISPRNIHMMNYGNSPQKISPNYSQYNPPEYAQHYQHRRASIPQDYYQQTCRTNPYVNAHQISPESSDNRAGSGGGLRHFIENWAEEEATAEITPIFKDNIRVHNNESSNEQVFVISPSDIPQLENVSLVPTENGQYIIKSGALDNSVVRIKETTESNGERTVNLQIVEASSKPDCMLAEENEKEPAETTPVVPYQENQTLKDCEETSATTPALVEPEKNKEPETVKENEETTQENTTTAETSVIVSNEVSVIKDMPLIDEDHAKILEESREKVLEELTSNEKDKETEENIEEKKEVEESQMSPSKRTQRIFSVDDIINNIGTSPTQTRRNSLQLPAKPDEEQKETTKEDNQPEDEEIEYRNAISVEDDSVILEIGGAWVQLNINELNGTKVLSVLPLSESLVIDVNGNYQENANEAITTEDVETTKEPSKEDVTQATPEEPEVAEEVVEETPSKEEVTATEPTEEAEALTAEEPVMETIFEDINATEVVIGGEVVEDSDEVLLDLSVEYTKTEETPVPEQTPISTPTEETRKPESEEAVRTEVIEPTLTEETQKPTVEESSVTEKIKKTTLEEPTVIEEMKKPTLVEFTSTEEIKQPALVEFTLTEEIKKAKSEEPSSKKRDDRKRSRDGDDRKKSSSKRSKEEERPKLKKMQKDDTKRSRTEISKTTSEARKEKKDTSPLKKSEDAQEFAIKLKKVDKKLLQQNSVEEEKVIKLKKVERKLSTQSSREEKNEKRNDKKPEDHTSVKLLEKDDETQIKWKRILTTMSSLDNDEDNADKEILPQAGPVVETTEEKLEPKQEEVPQSTTDSIEISKPNSEEKETEKPFTKAAKKLYEPSAVKKVTKEEKSRHKKVDMKRSISKLEETVNKIKSLKEKSIKEEKIKKTSIKESEKKSLKIVKKVTFNLEAEVREISKDDIDRKKLSWEEYSSRKRKLPSISEPEENKNKIMENTVTSTDDINDEVVEKVAMDIENAIKDNALKKSPPKMTNSNWENDTPSPQSPVAAKNDVVISTTNRKCIIDVNEFNIKPIQNASTPSPVSSSQFSYHSEDDSLQVYKDVVDSKLNSLNIKIPKISKPKPVERFSILFDRFLNKGSLNCDELEEVKKFIEIKRKMLEEEKKLNYEVRGERDYKDLKLHFKKIPEKRKKKRFRNLYTEDTSEDSDSSQSSDKGAGDYSVYQRDSQGVPKLIIKRNSGLPQPFVKLERSQAVELLAKKRKLY